MAKIRCPTTLRVRAMVVSSSVPALQPTRSIHQGHCITSPDSFFVTFIATIRKRVGIPRQHHLHRATTLHRPPRHRGCLVRTLDCYSHNPVPFVRRVRRRSAAPRQRTPRHTSQTSMWKYPPTSTFITVSLSKSGTPSAGNWAIMHSYGKSGF